MTIKGKMNTSKFINPALCRTCGKCCKSFTLQYPKKTDLDISEVDRFRLLDNDLITVTETKDYFFVEFHIKCSKLKEEQGHYTCTIYNSPERPLLCAEYPFLAAINCPHKLYIPETVKEIKGEINGR